MAALVVRLSAWMRKGRRALYRPPDPLTLKLRQDISESLEAVTRGDATPARLRHLRNLLWVKSQLPRRQSWGDRIFAAVVAATVLWGVWMVRAVPTPLEATIELATSAVQFTTGGTLTVPGFEVSQATLSADSLEYSPASGAAPVTVAARAVELRAAGQGLTPIALPPISMPLRSEIGLYARAGPEDRSRVFMTLAQAAGTVEPLAIALHSGDRIRLSPASAADAAVSADRLEVRPSNRLTIDMTGPRAGLLDMRAPIRVTTISFDDLHDGRAEADHSVLQYSAIQSGVVRFTELPGKRHELGPGDRLTSSSVDGWIRRISYVDGQFQVRWQGTVDDIAVRGARGDISLAPTRMDIWYENRPWQPITAFVVAVSAVFTGTVRWWRRAKP